MASKTARPGRTLLTFLTGLAIAFGLVALAGNWKPELGLDLQGGTRITLIAKGDPSAESLREARSIIDQRVNGSGVSEAEVVTQGSRIIVVEIPGKSRRDLTETVERQAQLRFRIVACSDANPGPCATAATDTEQDPTQPDPEPGTGVTPLPTPTATDSATAAPSDTPTTAPTDAPTDSATPSDGASSSGAANRAPAHYADETSSPSPSESPSESPSASASDDGASEGASDGASDGASEGASTDPSASPTTVPPSPAPEGGPDVADPLTWIDAPNQEAIQAYNDFTCPADFVPANVEDDPKKPLVTCGVDEDADGNQYTTKYLLSSSMIEGNQLDSADAVVPQGQVNYVVSIDFDGGGTKKFSEISKALVGTEKQFAVVLDGQVLSAPTMDALITNGQAQIEGNFTQQSAKSLATSLKYGALPIAFEDPSTETIGPSLAGDQLKAGLVAGGIGLGLVLVYCMLYYRGLGLVVVASLLAAAATTYALVLLPVSYTHLTLPKNREV